MSEPLAFLRGISFNLKGDRVIRNAELTLSSASVHALIGTPGKGKSVLGRILAGGEKIRYGEYFFQQHPFRSSGFNAALRAGIAYCGRDEALSPALDLRENLLLGRERLAPQTEHINQLYAGAEALGLPTPEAKTTVASLSPSTRQLFGVLRAACPQPKLLVLDEPGAGLLPDELTKLHAYLRTLATRGVCVVYITSCAANAFAVADCFTILRDGRTLAARQMTAVHNAEELQELVPGCSLADIYPPHTHKAGATLLEVIGLRFPESSSEISFTLRKGEILGLAGLPKAGRAQLGRTLCGLAPATGGVLCVNGRNLKARQLCPSRARQAGLLYLDAETGIDDNAVGQVNILLPSLQDFRHHHLFNPVHAAAAADQAVKSARLAPEVGERASRFLNAFERQSLMLLRARCSGCNVLILHQPGRGVDTAQKQELYQQIYALAASGRGILLIGNDSNELQRICDTIAVLHCGELCPPRPADKWTSEEITLYATSGKFGAFSLL